MNLTKIRYFVEVAACGSFSGAAQKLYTSQPNVSKQIAQMEQELDFPLFVRDKRTVRLTAAGSLLYEKLRDFPGQMDALVEQARAIARREGSVLSMGILEGQDMRPQLLYRLSLARELYPGIELEVERNSFANLRHGLQSGHYDIIVTLDFDVEKEELFISRPLYDQAPAIAINRRHPLAEKESLDLSELSGENFVVISPDESPAGYTRFIEQCQESGFSPKIVRQPRSLESLLLCVEMGVGVALLDQNTRLTYNDEVRVIPQPNKHMAVVAAYLKTDFRAQVQRLLKLLAGEGTGGKVHSTY